MRLKLHNFRRYRDSEFRFDNKGLFLLDAPSGGGKSTIFNAILYALYGELKDPYTFGESDTFVELDILLKGKLYKMKRQAKPKKFTLVVKGKRKEKSSRGGEGISTIVDYTAEYEGTDAQGVIDTNFLTFHEFLASSYIRQKEKNSILSLTAQDQLNFIKRLALDEKTEMYKNKIKEISKERAKHVDLCKAAVTVAQNHHIALSETSFSGGNFSEEGEEKRENPLIEIGVETGDKLEELIQTLKEKISLLRQKKETAQEKLNERREYESNLKEKDKKRLTLEVKLKSLKERVVEVEPFDKEKLLQLEQQLSLTKLYETYTKEKERYISEESRYFQEIDEKMKVISELLISEEEYERLSKIREKDQQRMLKLEKRKALKENAIKHINEVISQLKQQKVANNEELENSDNSYMYLYEKLLDENRLLSEKVKKISFEIKEIKDMLEKGDVYVCPHCDKEVQWNVDEKTLIPFDVLQSNGRRYSPKKLEEDMKALSKEQASKNKLISQIGVWTVIVKQNRSDASIEIPVDLEKRITDEEEEKLDLYKVNKESYEKYKEISEKHILSDSLAESQAKLHKLKKKLKGLLNNKENIGKADSPILRDKRTIKQLEDEIIELRTISKEFDHKQEEQDEIQAQITLLEKRLESFTKSNEDIEKLDSIEEYEKKLISLGKSIEKKYEEQRKYEQVLLEYERYEIYQNHLGQIEKARLDLENKEKVLRIAEEKYKSILVLKEKSAQAEILALENIINTVNEHAKFHLDRMFEDDPITIEIHPLKETKKDVITKINTRIIYKGETYKTFSQLSGGEQDRASLAFILAVNSMVSSPLLLLDECVVSLDAALNNEIFEHLNETKGGKCIITTGHNTIKGLFDKVYEIL